ncbi:type II toxin-antitoxin system ParD family antitoxin [Sphingomonas sp. CA1-15]|uniref:Type II toxin-antitoxin system ParD family antitoxin n=2 Tax=Sphingomonas immobilis TaxID=3063997 RepID=A0ABT9A4C7_9SPHN|nr:type II toxin-antitoxin system ParD family antitoxin [Sphingomonas sp. CA1-15]MDO7844696.1 type II toxin-antitoxin system ParD family antitoxin [Sphingomonas sp. CA1-15]
MPDALSEWVAARVAEGRYADAAEYVRDLVRRDQEAAEDDTRWVRAMIEEGLASGFLDEEPEDILAAIIAEDPDLRA